MADLNCRRPSNVGRTPKFLFRGKSAVLGLFDSNGTGVRVADSDVCYMAKSGQTWTDVYYPAVDVTPFFRESGFPFDVFQWAMSVGHERVVPDLWPKQSRHQRFRTPHGGLCH